jgi:hypothetical protein
MTNIVRFLRPVFFVRWKEPRVADLGRVQSELDAAAELSGGPVIYVAIVPADCSPPDDRTRERFSSTMQDVLVRCETMHFVMEGEGFKNAILRTSLATILLVRGQRTKVFVHKTLVAALNSANDLASKRNKFVVPSMIRQAHDEGLATLLDAERQPG